MKLKPLSDNLIIKPIEEVTKGGIVLPETINTEKPEKGEVVAIGIGRLLENGQRAAMEIKVGDNVIFKKYSPDDVEIDGQKYLVINESDVIVIVK